MTMSSRSSNKMQRLPRWLALTTLLGAFLAPSLADTCPMCPVDNFPLDIRVTVEESEAANEYLNYASRLNEEANRSDFNKSQDHCRDIEVPITSLPSTESIHHLADVACEWNYICEYNPQRLPAYLYHADCTSQANNQSCQEVYYRVPVLKTTGCSQVSGGRWTMEFEAVSVACTTKKS